MNTRLVLNALMVSFVSYIGLPTRADVKLTNVFGSNMVLQLDMPV